MPGVGAARIERLIETFGSVDGLRDASLEDLAAVRGICPGTAKRVQEALR